jgi:RNA-directed DNA polymerase
VNTGAPLPSLVEARQRVHAMQCKLHQWAAGDSDRRFDDLYNLVYDPAFLVVAWNRVKSNTGARSAGVDGIAPRTIGNAAAMLDGLRAQLKDRQFAPRPVREKTIPKATGKVRRLGIPTAPDRVVQAVLKLVLEPIFEADFKPCSYGFRPKRRAQDALAEIHYLGSPTRNYEWVFEADITACFDEISHSGLLARMRKRVKDKRIMSLVAAFLKAGVLSEDAIQRDTITGTPQGGILSPLLANIALSVLDEHFARKWEELGPYWLRAKRRKQGVATYRLVRYADDFVVMVGGTQADADALWDETSAVLAPIGLRLSVEKTTVCHIDEGFDFLGCRIQRRSWRGRAGARAVYIYPSKRALLRVMDKIRDLTRREKHRTLADLLHRLNPVLRGWCNYFRHGAATQTFSYLDHFTWWRVVGWMHKRHNHLNWGTLRHRHLPNWEIRDGQTALFRPRAVPVIRHRYRGERIPTPWTSTTA